MQNLPITIEIDARAEDITDAQLDAFFFALNTYTALHDLNIKTQNGTHAKLRAIIKVEDGSQGLTSRKSQNLSNRIESAVGISGIGAKAHGWSVDRIELARTSR